MWINSKLLALFLPLYLHFAVGAFSQSNDSEEIQLAHYYYHQGKVIGKLIGIAVGFACTQKKFFGLFGQLFVDKKIAIRAYTIPLLNG